MVKSLAKSIFNWLPVSIKNRLLSAYYEYRANSIRTAILSHYDNKDITDPSIEEAIGFINDNGIHVFPYSFTKKYEPLQYEVFHDDTKNLPYIIYLGKRLYGKRGMDEESMRFLNSGVLLEQDDDSPHRYLTSNFTVDPGDIVADVGVAEGNFGLSVVDKVEKLYLFESDPSWIEPLQATFEPWQDNVEIVNKRVSNQDDFNNVCIDTFFGEIKPDFIKIDVDGGERSLIDGAQQLFSSTDKLKVAICTYHNAEDAEEFNSYFNQKSFTTDFSKNYMIFYYDQSLKAPFFRKGLLRAVK